MGRSIINCGGVVTSHIVEKSIELRVVKELLGLGST
jgi:hypothetical protein